MWFREFCCYVNLKFLDKTLPLQVEDYINSSRRGGGVDLKANQLWTVECGLTFGWITQ